MALSGGVAAMRAGNFEGSRLADRSPGQRKPERMVFDLFDERSKSSLLAPTFSLTGNRGKRASDATDHARNKCKAAHVKTSLLKPKSIQLY